MVELVEVLIWYRMLIQGCPSIFLQERSGPCRSGEAAAAAAQGLQPHQQGGARTLGLLLCRDTSLDITAAVRWVFTSQLFFLQLHESCEFCIAPLIHFLNTPLYRETQANHNRDGSCCNSIMRVSQWSLICFSTVQILQRSIGTLKLMILGECLASSRGLVWWCFFMHVV